MWNSPRFPEPHETISCAFRVRTPSLESRSEYCRSISDLRLIDCHRERAERLDWLLWSGSAWETSSSLIILIIWLLRDWGFRQTTFVRLESTMFLWESSLFTLWFSSLPRRHRWRRCRPRHSASLYSPLCQHGFFISPVGLNVNPRSILWNLL